MTTIPDPHPSARCSRQLDREWSRLRTAPWATAAVRRWAVNDGRLAGLAVVDDLQSVIDATQRGRPGGDAILLGLVELAGREQLAGRVVLQRLLRPLLAGARPHLRHEPDAVELALAGAWLSIHRYDTDRRRTHVASSLVSDTLDRTFRQPWRRTAGREVAATHGWLDHHEVISTTDPLVELADVVAEARRCGVGDRHLRLVADLVRTGSTAAVADRAGVSARTIRNRRTDAVAHIRAAVDTAA